MAKLPGELQKHILAMMMKENEIENKSDRYATNAFVNTPLLHAMDRYVRVQDFLRVTGYGDEQSLVFISMCPYTAEIKEVPKDWRSCLTGSFFGYAGGLGCGVLTSMPFVCYFEGTKGVSIMMYTSAGCGAGGFCLGAGIFLYLAKKKYPEVSYKKLVYKFNR